MITRAGIFSLGTDFPETENEESMAMLMFDCEILLPTDPSLHENKSKEDVRAKTNRYSIFFSSVGINYNDL